MLRNCTISLRRHLPGPYRAWRRWSSCDVCPHTLSELRLASRDKSSGIRQRILFVQFLRWCLLVLCFSLLAPAFAGVEIIDLPSPVEDDCYDLAWDVTVQTPPTTPFTIGVEQSNAGRGYLLRFDGGRVTWQQQQAEK